MGDVFFHSIVFKHAAHLAGCDVSPASLKPACQPIRVVVRCENQCSEDFDDIERRTSGRQLCRAAGCLFLQLALPPLYLLGAHLRVAC
jgi:hypothetical protein